MSAAAAAPLIIVSFLYWQLWSTSDGRSWTVGARVDFHSKLPVTSLSEMDGLLLCGYEAPYTHSVGQNPITVGMLRAISLHGEQPSVEIVIDPQLAPYAHEQRVNCITTGLLAGAPIVCTGGEEGRVRLWKAGGASLLSMVIMFESPPPPPLTLD